MPTGIERIAAERRRQTEELGYSIHHDLSHADSDLAFAAACYATPVPIYLVRVDQDRTAHDQAAGTAQWVEPWPLHWDREVRKGVATPQQRIRDLEKAGALMAAEIDRIQAQIDAETEEEAS